LEDEAARSCKLVNANLKKMRIATAPGRRFLDVSDAPSKRAVLEAALRLFVRHGVEGTSVRAIGVEAGYTGPAMFRFFHSKDDLAAYLYERCHLPVYRAVAAAAVHGTFREALRAVVDAFVDAMDEDVEAFVFVVDSWRRLFPLLRVAVRRQSVLRVLRLLVARGIDEGVVIGFSSPEVPVAALFGLMAELSRDLCFGQVRGRAGDHRAEVQRAAARIFAS
jgi:TetR/AcrR family transcriptional regulator, repressor of fatR-cypB operon